VVCRLTIETHKWIIYQAHTESPYSSDLSKRRSRRFAARKLHRISRPRSRPLLDSLIADSPTRRLVDSHMVPLFFFLLERPLSATGSYKATIPHTYTLRQMRTQLLCVRAQRCASTVKAVTLRCRRPTTLAEMPNLFTW